MDHIKKDQKKLQLIIFVICIYSPAAVTSLQGFAFWICEMQHNLGYLKLPPCS